MDSKNTKLINRLKAFDNLHVQILMKKLVKKEFRTFLMKPWIHSKALEHDIYKIN